MLSRVSTRRQSPHGNMSLRYLRSIQSYLIQVEANSEDGIPLLGGKSVIPRIFGGLFNFELFNLNCLCMFTLDPCVCILFVYVIYMLHCS